MAEPITNFADFVTRAERRVGGAFTLGLVVLGALALYAVRGTILGLLGFAVTAVGYSLAVLVGGGLLVFLIMLLLNPTIQTEIWHAQNAIALWVSEWAMKKDPFGRMRAFANEALGAQYARFEKAAKDLEKGLIATRQRIDANTETLDKAKATAESLRDRHMDATTKQWDSDAHRDDYRLEAQRIGFAEESLKKLRASELRKMALLKIVDRWRNTFRFEIESTIMSAQFLEDDFNEANETATTLEAASTAFGKGKLAQADVKVRQYVKQMTAERMAQATVLMKQIPELTRLSDLKGDVAEDELNARFAELERESQRAYVKVQEDHRLLEAGGGRAIAEVVQHRQAEPATTRRYLR